MKKVLLYSGGMDSWLINKLWAPDIKLYIDVHGAYSETEKLHLPKDTIIIDFPLLGMFERQDRYIPLRNLYFLMIASNYGDNICLGATATDVKKDSNFKFLKTTEKIINDLLTDDHREIKIETQFALMDKQKLLYEVLNRGISLTDVYKETFSCYNPIDNQPCYNCLSCFRKFSLLYINNHNYSELQQKKMWEYIKNNILFSKTNPLYSQIYNVQNSENAILIQTIQKLREKYE